jgi:16S rRNA (guanine527-N7)-methyltransferase
VDHFAAQAAQFGWRLSGPQLDQFARYQDMLIEWNQRINLTAIQEPELIQERHFLDSLTCTFATGDLNAQHVADVGAGAGFPGIPLRILYPQMELTLIDSVKKKTRFLQEVVLELGLSDVAIIAQRAEVLGKSPNHRGRYDWVIARGVARLRVLVELLLPLCCINGRVLAQKGSNAGAEAKEAAAAISLLGGAPPLIYPVPIPIGKGSRNLVVIEKVAKSPARYPRRSGIPAKRPL